MSSSVAVQYGYGRQNRNHQDRNNYLPSSGQVQNVQNARVYIFGDADVEEEEVTEKGYEMSEIRPRGKDSRKKWTEAVNEDEQKPLCIERTIVDGDTLQGFALQYGVPVAELKRLNNLITEQDFYRLKSIKVPVKRFGLLTEIQEEERRRPNATAPSESQSIYEDEEDEDSVFEVRTLSIRDSLQENDEAREFLQNMDKDLEKIRKSTRTEKSSLTEVTSILSARYIQPLSPPKPKLDGANCGFKWWTMVIIMFVVGVLTPLFYWVFKDRVNGAIQP
ncbi:lysM and putative peptidoglycan-binding domain-containing protein 3-like [Ptychodera flava]|uniref:lysM and putative peptidoglycan-binding domain-containing protein 3-like n=1 Tax=Ptychodera flava TaxID=63121 RepID=UPI003969C6F4